MPGSAPLMRLPQLFLAAKTFGVAAAGNANLLLRRSNLITNFLIKILVSFGRLEEAGESIVYA